jgi:hypothetical protein
MIDNSCQDVDETIALVFSSRHFQQVPDYFRQITAYCQEE